MKTFLGGLLTVLLILIGYFLITAGRVIFIGVFSPDTWSTEKIVATAGGAFALIGLFKVFKRKE